MDLQDSTPAKDAQDFLSVICLISIAYSLFYTLSKTCQSASAFYPLAGFDCVLLSLFHLALSWFIHKWHRYEGKELTFMSFFSFCFLLTQYATCQVAARGSWSPREEEPGAEHKKAGRGNVLSGKGSVLP